MRHHPTSTDLTISHYSPSTIDLLGLNLPNGGVASIFDKDIFKVLAAQSQSSSSHKAIKSTVRESVRKGVAVSLEMELLTGTETRKSGVLAARERRVEEKFVGHWTPVKDEEGAVGFVVLTIAPI